MQRMQPVFLIDLCRTGETLRAAVCRRDRLPGSGCFGCRAFRPIAIGTWMVMLRESGGHVWRIVVARDGCRRCGKKKSGKLVRGKMIDKYEPQRQPCFTASHILVRREVESSLLSTRVGHTAFDRKTMYRPARASIQNIVPVKPVCP